MKIDGVAYRAIWVAADGWSVEIIDQTKLPHEFRTLRLTTLDAAAHAIRSMQVRGAPLIGATAAYGIALACAPMPRRRQSGARLRPLLGHAADGDQPALGARRRARPAAPAWRRPSARDGGLCTRRRDLRRGRRHQLRRSARTASALIRAAARRKGAGRVNILTHCNAGWLATVDWGTALAPIYRAHDAGIAVHVWVDETRPRNQGASLTAWELGKHGVPHTRDRRQCRRPPHAARHGRPVHRRHRPGDGERRRLQQDRHLPEGAGGAPTTTCRSTWRCRRRPSTGRSPTACARSRSRSATPREVTHLTGRTARWPDGDGRGHAGRRRRRQLRLRRDAGAAGDRADHRARRDRSVARGPAQAVPGAAAGAGVLGQPAGPALFLTCRGAGGTSLRFRHEGAP